MPETVLLSTAYFPPIRYFCKILHYKEVYIEQFENYNKQTYRNRCNILSANGPLALTIPVLKTDNPKIPIKEIEIDFRSRWKDIHWRAIESGYRSSPFFMYYADDIYECFFKEENKLFDFNNSLILCMLELLSISKKIHFTTEFKKADVPFDDFSDNIKPKHQPEDPFLKMEPYYQVFERKFGFVPELSILDLLFNLGPSAEEYLDKST